MKPENVEPIPPASVPARWDYETDVLVMGGGGSGLAAAMGAVEQGIRVMVMEKADDVGGESAFAMLAVGFGSRKWREVTGLSWTEEDLYETIRTLPQTEAGLMARRADPRMLKNNLTWAAYLVDRLEEMGIKWYPKFTLKEPNYRYPGIVLLAPISTDLADYTFEYPSICKFGAVTRTLERWLRKRGVEFLLGTPASALVTDDTGRVVGVQGKTKDGKTVFVRARGVIDTTGGFACNRDMLKHYHNTGFNAGCTTAPATKMGDGIRMCQGAGAIVGDMTSSNGEAGGITCLKRGTGTGSWGQNVGDAPIQITRQPGFYVNRVGLRFANEHFSVQIGYLQLIDQPDSLVYSIFGSDENGEPDAQAGERKLFGREMGIFLNDDDIRSPSDNPPYTPYYPTEAPPFCDWPDGIKRGIDTGTIKVADTIEELAEIYGIDPKRLKQSVSEYNASCERGADDPLFGKDKGYLRPIKNPPFYGIEHGPRIVDTTGGVRVNEKGQAVDKRGDPIPGLYAGSHSICGLNGRGGAMGVMGGMSFGYIAGRNAAAET
ncbi:MAG: FAD-dependent oxidoreductase [Chloroflexota bacterium]